MGILRISNEFDYRESSFSSWHLEINFNSVTSLRCLRTSKRQRTDRPSSLSAVFLPFFLFQPTLSERKAEFVLKWEPTGSKHCPGHALLSVSQGQEELLASFERLEVAAVQLQRKERVHN